ncbi:MAG: hypothetical protein E7533_07400 [Ruminococcaceae bacterium]|nr:hypothetical protein [Oscillospiraceae bacterium]
MKRAISIILSLVIVLGLISGVPFAVSSVAADGDFSFVVSDDGKSYSVFAGRKDLSGEVTIPSTHNGLPVEKIGYGAFYNCSGITAVVVPDSVKTIDVEAFYNCNSLESVSLGKGVAEIGYGAFSGCEKLDEVYIPDSVNSIGDNVFAGCAVYLDESNWDNGCFYLGNHLIKVKPEAVNGGFDIKNGTKTVAGGAFFGCDGLVEINIPSSVVSIGDSAFEDCCELKSVVIPDSVEEIGENAFLNCTALEALKISNSVSEIKYGAFSRCNGLKYVEIPEGVRVIDALAFSECMSLKAVYIPDGVESINYGAFYACFELDKITIPDSVTTIGEQVLFGTAFYDDDNNWDNKALYVGNHLIKSNGVPNGEFSFKDGTVTMAEGAFFGCTGLQKVTIPESIKAISNYAFNDCATLKTVVFHDKLLTIGESAFSGCIAIDDLELPEGVKEIGKDAFYGCNGIEKLVLPDGIVSVGDGAFGNCRKLESAIIPESIKTIGADVFENCDGFRYVFYKGTKSQWDKIDISSSNGVLLGSGIHYQSTDHTKSDWITVKATVHKAGKKYIECTQCGKVFESKKLPQLLCKKPVISAISNKSDGVKIAWGKVEGADSYSLYRKVSGGSYKYLGKTTKTSYTDKTAKSGTKYYYVVKSVNEAGKSEKSTAKGILYVAAPVLKKASNTASGVKFTWEKVSGADGYIVYRKLKGGSWENLGKTTKTSYTDKTAKSGKTYYYTVKAYDGSIKSSYDSSGLKIVAIKTPTLKSATSTKSGVVVKWSKVTGADGYIIYRKTGSASWERVGKVKGSDKVSFTDKTAKKGKTYTYTVKAYKGSEKSSYNSKGLTVKDKY